MLWLFLCIGCIGLSADGEQARARLAESLVERDDASVERATRVAAQWRGKDPQLDRLMGDALANVLMRPEDGLALLEANPAPEDDAWRQAMLGAGLRTGDRARLDGVWAELGITPMRLQSPTFEQMVARALQDPVVGHDLLESALLDCGLLNAQPSVGRKEVDMPLPPELLAGARALGATRVVLGRPLLPSDPDPIMGKGDVQCLRTVVVGLDVVPDPLPPRGLVAAATDGEHRVYLDLSMREGLATAYATSDREAGARWLTAAGLLAEGREVSAELGKGLRVPP